MLKILNDSLAWFRKQDMHLHVSMVFPNHTKIQIVLIVQQQDQPKSVSNDSVSFFILSCCSILVRLTFFFVPLIILTHLDFPSGVISLHYF